MRALVISPLQAVDDEVEIVERKGVGHPDTICDALAENFSRNLSREYLDRFGSILHHNVDKALLRGGRAAPAFGAGTILEPIEIYLAGRATTFGDGTLPIREIAVEGSRAWLQANMRGLDAGRHVHIHEIVRPGSHELRSLVSSQRSAYAFLANDTSIGVGYAPLSRLESLVLAIERQINEEIRGGERPAWGEDVKVMGIRRGSALQLTVACAIIGRHVRDLVDYVAEKARLASLVQELAGASGFEGSEVAINAADNPPAGDIYLTVTGTSAEAGDDGEVGRGNRSNGLITPCRPMSLEAVAGKNPSNHVGKIYNILAREIAEALVSRVAEVKAAHCLMVSRIGASVDQPQLIHVKLATQDGLPCGQLGPQVEETVGACLSQIPKLIDEFVTGTIRIF